MYNMIIQVPISVHSSSFTRSKPWQFHIREKNLDIFMSPKKKTFPSIDRNLNLINITDKLKVKFQ
jgi:hypothetical protein